MGFGLGKKLILAGGEELVMTNQTGVAKLRFPVIVEIDEDGYYIVSCPLFKGCHTYGETIEEAMDNIKEVIEMCLEEEGVDRAVRFVGYREVELEYGKASFNQGKGPSKVS